MADVVAALQEVPVGAAAAASPAPPPRPGAEPPRARRSPEPAASGLTEELAAETGLSEADVRSLVDVRRSSERSAAAGLLRRRGGGGGQGRRLLRARGRAAAPQALPERRRSRDGADRAAGHPAAATAEPRGAGPGRGDGRGTGSLERRGAAGRDARRSSCAACSSADTHRVVADIEAMVRATLRAVRVDLQTNAPVLLLQEAGASSGTLPIYIGTPRPPRSPTPSRVSRCPRPLTHDLLRDVTRRARRRARGGRDHLARGLDLLRRAAPPAASVE